MPSAKIQKLLKEQTAVEMRLDAVRARIREAVLAEAAFEVGDVVVIITAAYDLPQGLLGKSKKPKHIAEVRRIGQIQKLLPDVHTGTLEYDIHAQKTNGGFHATRTLFVGYGDRIEKYVEETAS